MEFDVNSINKLRLSTSAFNLRVIEKEDISNIVCKLKNVDKDWVTFTQDNNTLVLAITEKGSMIRTIWNNNSKRTIKIFIPKNKVFKSITISAGVGLTRLKNISCEKLKLSAGIGVSQLIGVTVTKRTKIAAGVGRVMIKNTTLRNLSLNGGVGLVQCTGKLLGKIRILGGVGKIELTVKADKADYNIKTKSTFFDNIHIDGVSAKNYNSKNPDAENLIRISGGIGNIALRFKNQTE